MKKTFLLFLLLTFTQLLLAQAQTTPPAAKPEQPATISAVLDQRWSGIEKQFTDLADAMPEDKYAFAPTTGEFKGVLNFGEQVKHVAATNYRYASTMLGEKPPADTSGESGPDAIKTKAAIMKYLRDSFTYAHRAMKETTDQNAVAPITPPGSSRTVTRLGIALNAVGHCFDHYGQLVEYLRMNGIIPPASRR